MADAAIAPLCPVTQARMHRDIKKMALVYRAETLTFDMPGWYCNASGESIHTDADMKTSDRILKRLKARVDIRHSRKKTP